ncbi:hypothetical protein F8S13_18330 [Chloroflexia bacterium SDU3-3]|nr:hypothetical protein F8S13_18330 [Chloroflexia bacterium SDU3-3]
MAVAKHGRRQITINQQLFVWWFGEDVDNCLHIVSNDKQLNIRYSAEVHFQDTSPFVDVLGSRFPGLPHGRTGWYRVHAPTWHEPNIIAPQFVRQLIEWCHTDHPAIHFYPLRPEEHMRVHAMWDHGVPAFDCTRAIIAYT